MNPITLAALLMENRHDAEATVRITGAALDQAEDPKAYATDLALILVGLCHTAGHNSPRVNVILDLFSTLPQTVEANTPDVFLATAEDVEDEEGQRVVFEAMTEGTAREDRVWTAKRMGKDAVVTLDGNGFKPKYLIVGGAKLKDATRLRDHLSAMDGR